MEKPIPQVKEASVAQDNTAKQARMAEALRANLRRRKTQSREQDTAEVAPADPRAVQDAMAPDRSL